MKFKNNEVIDWVGIDNFHMALHLDRAMEQGSHVASKYIEELKNRNQLPEKLISITDVTKYLTENVYNFVFKNKIENQIELDGDIDKWSDLENEYIMPKRESIKTKS